MNPYASKSESFKKLNPHLFAPQHVNETAKSLLDKVVPRVRQSSTTLNKLEQEFLQTMPNLLVQALKFKLGNGVWYTPDFVSTDAFRLRAYEVKGPYFRDDAIVKLKVAAATHTYVDFHLVWKEDGRWCNQFIRP